MDDTGGLRDLHRLKLIGVGAPIAFLAVFELCRVALIEASFEAPVSNVIAAAMGVAFALAFGSIMFIYIERAQRDIVRRNRDLAYVDAIALAIQGQVDPLGVVRGALEAIVGSTGAAEARATIQPLDAEAGPPDELVVSTGRGAGDALAAPDHVLDIPLATSATSIGRVELRIPSSRVRTLPSPDAIATAANQLAAAVQIAQLVGDLERRKHEGHTLYQALLQISNQRPLPEILGGIVLGARERLGATDSQLCLTHAVHEALGSEGDLAEATADGRICDGEWAPDGADGTSDGHRCRLSEPGLAATLHVPVRSPGEVLGQLSVCRADGPPFSERDRRYLMTLAGIAAIAITGERLRERDRQGAILAERDRIARELHDSLAQVLGSNHLRLRTLLARPAVAREARVAGELEDLAVVNEEAYRDVREAILGLREASRTQGLLDALGAYLDKYAQQSGIAVELDSALDGEPSLPVAVEIQLIRVIQEALTNVRKHARATKARVRLASAEPGMMTIVVEDDGRGFDPTATTVHRDGGYGLQTMRERMQLAGGSLRIDSRPGRGTRVVAVVPDGSRLHSATALADHR